MNEPLSYRGIPIIVTETIGTDILDDGTIYLIGDIPDKVLIGGKSSISDLIRAVKAVNVDTEDSE